MGCLEHVQFGEQDYISRENSAIYKHSFRATSFSNSSLAASGIVDKFRLFLLCPLFFPLPFARLPFGLSPVSLLVLRIPFEDVALELECVELFRCLTPPLLSIEFLFDLSPVFALAPKETRLCF